MNPTFIGIGAQKCASTWIYDILADHPQVCVSRRKEIDFFSNYYDYGFQWYERNFECADKRPAIGEVSPSYFHGCGVPKRVHDYNPDMRLILLLRDPVQRAISNHKHEVRIGHIQGENRSFEYGVANNPSYIEQGLYATHLKRWLEYFPRDKILVILLEDIIANPMEVAKTVYEFLSVDQSHESMALREYSNTSYLHRWSSVEDLKNSVRAIFQNAGLGSIWRALGSMGPRTIYRSINRKPPEMVLPDIDKSTIIKLRAEFVDEIRSLEKLIGRPLTDWL